MLEFKLHRACITQYHSVRHVSSSPLCQWLLLYIINDYVLSVMLATKTVHNFVTDSQFSLCKMFHKSILMWMFVINIIVDRGDMFVKYIVASPDHGEKIAKYLKL